MPERTRARGGVADPANLSGKGVLLPIRCADELWASMGLSPGPTGRRDALEDRGKVGVTARKAVGEKARSGPGGIGGRSLRAIAAVVNWACVVPDARQLIVGDIAFLGITGVVGEVRPGGNANGVVERAAPGTRDAGGRTKIGTGVAFDACRPIVLRLLVDVNDALVKGDPDIRVGCGCSLPRSAVLPKVVARLFCVDFKFAPDDSLG
mmetsp:Transcript_32935/g.79381  ORF Transcript_32935/g.79381 Transcript_32935/m.79381 type:complete len:208 (+) Transcript_32935:214-837(+)